MSLQEKEAIVKELGTSFSEMPAAFLVDYRGCTCHQLTSLRDQLRPLGATMHVVKNTMARKAVAGTDLESLSEQLVGPTAVIWASEDPVSPAKVLKEFHKEHEATFEIKAGVVDGAVVDSASICQLADLPSREVLLSQLLSVINAPATKLLQTINAPAQNLLNVLSAWKDKLEEK
jgi:large subunit ribosomal protein L10